MYCSYVVIHVAIATHVCKCGYVLLHQLWEYRAAVWIVGYCLILSDVSHIVSKFINFQVAKMYRNNGTFYGDTKL